MFPFRTRPGAPPFYRLPSGGPLTVSCLKLRLHSLTSYEELLRVLQLCVHQVCVESEGPCAFGGGEAGGISGYLGARIHCLPWQPTASCPGLYCSCGSHSSRTEVGGLEAGPGAHKAAKWLRKPVWGRSKGKMHQSRYQCGRQEAW